MMKPQEFRNEVIGKGFDMDGAYGNQCWDGANYYMKKLGYKIPNCTVTGYVRDIWDQRATNGILDSCDEVSLLQEGDIVTFKVDPNWTPYSHIAIFMKDLGNGFGLFLGQNQGGANGVFNEIKLPYSATHDTSFRPKCYRDLFKPSTPAPAPTPPKPAAPSKKPDQVLSVGSIVEFVGLLRVEKYDAKKDLVYNSRIGGWISPSICYEDSAKDGAKDQYFANTNATFTIKGRYTVGEVKKINGIWDAYLNELGFYVHCDPLTEVVEGR